MKLIKNSRVLLAGIIILTISISFARPAKAAAPAAISDLNCVFSGTQGTVSLSWSTPAGAVRYDVRYSSSTITVYNFSSCDGFYQDGFGLTNSATINSLTMNKNWFFAVKSVGANGELSEISNIVSCLVSTEPISSITDPLNGAVIAANKDYIIKGQSSDIGGSSVQKVEISFDGGGTWKTVAPKEAASTGFTWEYLWSKPAAGSYLIKIRATDWWDNVEIPKDGLMVQVLTEATSTTAKPIQQMSVEELKAKIVEIQQQIIQLLQQLITLVQSQIANH